VAFFVLWEDVFCFAQFVYAEFLLRAEGHPFLVFRPRAPRQAALALFSFFFAVTLFSPVLRSVDVFHEMDGPLPDPRLQRAAFSPFFLILASVEFSPIASR